MPKFQPQPVPLLSNEVLLPVDSPIRYKPIKFCKTRPVIPKLFLRTIKDETLFREPKIVNAYYFRQQNDT